MRVFFASENGPFPESRLWFNNLYLPLKDLGFDVVRFRFPLDEYNNSIRQRGLTGRFYEERNRPKLEHELLSQIKAEHDKSSVHVFFSYFWNPHCHPEIISRIREMGIITLNWYCNASYQFHLVDKIAPAYDFCLVPEKSRLHDYERIGAQPIYMQEAANPDIYKPHDVPVEFDVAFVGKMYANRADYIVGLLDAGIDVRVWGAGWPRKKAGLRAFLKELPGTGIPRAMRAYLKYGRLPARYPSVPPAICGGPLSDDEMIKMFSRAKISLGFSIVGETHRTSTPIRQLRLRDFEAPMSGAFYMVEHQDELEDFYVVGKEVVTYRSLDELIEKVSYYLTHEEERERIRKAGLERTRRDHTWQKRLSDAFGTALEAAGRPLKESGA